MLESQFILEQIHFAVNLLTAFVFFAVFWLYFDAWTVKKFPQDGLKFLGFLLISLSFAVHATLIEQTVLAVSFFGSDIINVLAQGLRVGGFLSLIIGLILDPLQKKPSEQSPKTEFTAALFILPAGLSLYFILSGVSPVLCVGIAFLYLLRGTIGLERHLKPVALTFFILAISEVLSLGYLFQTTGNINLYKFVAPFGPLWYLQHISIVAAGLVLQKWVFGYLLKRFLSQLFSIITTLIIIIFLMTTLSFSVLLLKNLEGDALSHLKTDVNILNYAVESKKAETLSDAQVAAQNPEVTGAIAKKDKKKLRELATSILLAKKHSFLIITSSSSAVLMRGDDPERIGDSLSGDLLVKRALKGESVSSVVIRDGVLAPIVSIRSASPIRDGSDLIGAVIVGEDIDNAFVDGIKNATGLDVSVYGDNIRSATTFIASDKKSRLIGIKEENSQVKSRVLEKGEGYSGSVNILNTPYFASYLPLKDMDSNPVGMLFVGKEQVSILTAAGRSIELTFIVSVILLIFSIIPTFLIARYITNQIK